ncbi:cache domain-containing protein [Desulfosporosinus sp. FKA]|uniref:cache domain-containing protein n=1 Tax=Desulfosporosinus sp. FKA TaxID=1969834 RepID=UPI000B4A0531|nr:cache domain-containing protein [Desulfosporosinus sp. FKA]
MRSLRHKLSILQLVSLIILAASLVMIFGWYMKDRLTVESSSKAQSDLTICKEFIDLKYPGSWVVRDGELYKGTTKMSLNSDIVDHISQITGDTVTVFLGDTRAATTLRSSNGERAIGTKASDNVVTKVLKNGQVYLGNADVIGQPYQSAYAPLRAENGVIIGMLYVGISQASEQESLKRSLVTLGGIGLALTALIALFAGLFLRKLIHSSSPEDIDRPLQEAAAGQNPSSSPGAAEIEKLEDALIQMAEQIQTLTGEINKSTATIHESSPPKGSLNTMLEQLKDFEPSNEFSSTETISQEYEPLFGLDTPWNSGADALPKGLNKATLNQIVHYLEKNRRPISTEEVAEGVKLTRVTVRRYLEFLEQCGALRSEQKCGTVGRPVKIFIPL